VTAIENRVRNLERRIEQARLIARECVRELLVDDSARHLIAERLPALGSIIVPFVRELIDDDAATTEVRCLAALAGIAAGDTEQSVIVLLDEVERDGEFTVAAARSLAAARAPGSAQVIKRALDRTALEQVDAIVVYLDALRALGVELSEGDRVRLGTGDWRITSAVAQWHPPAPA
jgi:hypothetical protein